MAKKDIDVSTEDISRVRSTAYDEYEETLIDQFRAMMAAIEALNETWKGPNHDDFVKTFDARSQGIDDFHKLVAAYLRAWDDACREYGNCESNVAGYVK